MRTTVAALAAGLLLAAAPAFTQPPGQAVPYKILFDPDRDVSQAREGPKNTLLVTVQFTLTQVGPTTEDISKAYKILIKENGRTVGEADVPRPKPSEDLSVVLAMDISGSMNE